ncbi:MAG: hypothetical protein NTW49_03955 [Bacteroidia bacterium]|nr:hypothetical protein [Bacteroidia bacterium]
MKSMIAKALVIISIVLLFFAMPSFSQFDNNLRLLDGGFSFGYYYKYQKTWNEEGLNLHYFPPFMLHIESGMNDNPNMGKLNHTFTWGAFAGFDVKDFDKNIDSANYHYLAYRKYSYCPLGLSFTFHYSGFLKDLEIKFDEKKIDLYVSLRLGIVYEHFHSNFDINKSFSQNYLGYNTSSTDKYNPYFAPQLGGRYYFNNNFAAFAELGYYNLSSFTIGVTYRFYKNIKAGKT